MKKNEEMIEEFNRLCEKYPDLKATKEYFEKLEEKEKNGSTINCMQIMYAVAKIKQINKNASIVGRENTKEEKREQKREEMDEMSQQIEDSILTDKKQRYLKVAGVEKGERFTANREVIYEQLSHQIAYLQGVMEQARKDRVREARREKATGFEQSLLGEIRGPASEWLKSCDRYIKGQMRKVQKEKEQSEIEATDVAAVGLESDEKERTLGEKESTVIVEDAENVEQIADNPDKNIADGLDAGVVVGAAATVTDPVLDELRRVMDEVRGNNEEEMDKEEIEQDTENSGETRDEDKGVAENFKSVIDLINEDEEIEQDTENSGETRDEESEFITDVKYDKNLEVDETEFITDVEYQPNLKGDKNYEFITDVENKGEEEKDLDAEEKITTPEPAPKTNTTSTAKAAPKVQYIYVGNPTKANETVNKSKDDTPDQVPDGTPVGDTDKKANKNGQPTSPTSSKTEKADEPEEKTETPKEPAIQALDNWAGQIVSKYKNGEKIDKILKEDKTVDSIAEKIKNDEITINDARKAVNDKMVSETGKSDKKVLDKIQKHLEQKTNAQTKQEKPKKKDEKGLQKVGFWTRILNFFRGNKGKNGKASVVSDKGKSANAITAGTGEVSQHANDFKQKYVAPALKNVEIGGIIIGDKTGTENHLNQSTITVVLNEGEKNEKKVRYYGGPEYQLRVPVKNENKAPTKDDEGR